MKGDAGREMSRCPTQHDYRGRTEGEKAIMTQSKQITPIMKFVNIASLLLFAVAAVSSVAVLLKRGSGFAILAVVTVVVIVVGIAGPALYGEWSRRRAKKHQ